MKKNIVILGSTGSIGQNALKIVEMFPDRFRVLALSARSNTTLLMRQIRRFRPPYAALFEPSSLKNLKKSIRGIEILPGEEGLKALCGLKESDIILNAVTGSSGLKYTVEAVCHGKKIALANKESLVMAGGLIRALLKKHGSEIIPVDSEHSALFHMLRNIRQEHVDSLILTASGGPFLNRPRNDFKRISLKETLAHPTWNMGSKITVDSATMMNKGFEVIEAHHLFRIPYERIEVVIHPQSVVHSMVRTIDNETYAQLSPPDMKYAILGALVYPDMVKSPLPAHDFSRPSSLTFRKPDGKKFPLLGFAYTAGKKGGNLPAALCCADDAAVHRFLCQKIRFRDIPALIQSIVRKIKYVENPDLGHIFWLEKQIRKQYGGN